MSFANSGTFPNLSLGHLAALACQLEAAAKKPGNVHPGARFTDLSYLDFVVCGQILGDVIDRQSDWSLGQTIEVAVRQTRSLMTNNVNLGIILLICPLARWLLESGEFDSPRMAAWLRDLSLAESRSIFRAIRWAEPGGLGAVPEADVGQVDLNDCPAIGSAMALASSRDFIARQWCNGFADVLEWFVPHLIRAQQRWGDIERAIIDTQVHWLARHSDSLVVRKVGIEVGEQLKQRAATATQRLVQSWDAAAAELDQLDQWLRADGHRRNPGTTADLICAALFVILVRGELKCL